MYHFKFYDFREISTYLKLRKGEVKFGEKVNLVSSFAELKASPAKYVLFGIPEDIGVRGNYGKEGTKNAWKTCLKYLLNIQSNHFTNPENLIVLGEIDCREQIQKAENIDIQDPNYHVKLGDLVQIIDEAVSDTVSNIISAGKIPIIIGGGHNNAYGNIKGAFNALKKPLNILNIDAHTDLRKTDYRHSGNGFSFARQENMLDKYRIFGLHQNYTPQYIFDELNYNSTTGFYLFEHLLLKSSEKIKQAFMEELELVAHDDFGLELDCDAIEDFPSSAQSPSGFPINMIRNFIRITGEEEKIKYIHICEAAPTKENEAEVGKALSYFITDFMQKEWKS